MNGICTRLRASPTTLWCQSKPADRRLACTVYTDMPVMDRRFNIDVIKNFKSGYKQPCQSKPAGGRPPDCAHAFVGRSLHILHMTHITTPACLIQPWSIRLWPKTNLAACYFLSDSEMLVQPFTKPCKLARLFLRSMRPTSEVSLTRLTTSLTGEMLAFEL